MVFAGACSFGILSTFVKLAYRQGYGAAEISASQAITGMVVLGLFSFVFRKEGQARTTWAEGWPLLLTGAVMGLTTFVYYVSVQYIPASVAIVILMQFTWMGLLLDWCIFGQRPGVAAWWLTAVILAGTVLSGGLTGGSHGQLSPAGAGYALLSALLYAVYIVASSRTGRHIPPLQRSAWMMTGSALAICLVNVQPLMHAHPDAGLLQWALFLGLFGTIIPPLLFAGGIPKIGAGISAIIMTAELPVAVICARLVLQEPLTWVQGAGVILMLLAIGWLQLVRSGR